MKLVTTNTADGRFHLLLDGSEAVRAAGFGDVAALRARLPLELSSEELLAVSQHPYQQHVTDYYAGDQAALSRIPHAQTGSDFQQQVWQAMATVPYGYTVSYKQLAEMVGRPAAVRAVGTTCGRNRLILLVPCHRVLKSDGSIGSYLYGSMIKQLLLRREQTWHTNRI